VKIANTSQSYFQTSSFDAAVRFVCSVRDIPERTRLTFRSCRNDDGRKYALLQLTG